MKTKTNTHKLSKLTLFALLFCLSVTTPVFALKFSFTYDSKYSQYFTPEVKAQIEEAGKFLSSYIGDSHTVDINISVNQQISAHAIGAPNAWLINSSTASISNKGSIAYSVNSLRDVGQSSIVQLTIHELMHTLGVTYSGSMAFKSQVVNGYYFKGAKTKTMNGGNNAALSSDQSHFQGGMSDPKGVVPRISDGGGNLISALDLAVLADLGYKIPTLDNVTGPKFIDVTLNDMYAMNYGVFVLMGMGGNDVLYGGNGKTVLAGLGGNDVLVSGNGETEMYGDQAGGNDMGIDGMDIFYIKSNSANHSIKDLDVKDMIYISPSLGITKAQIDAAGFKDGSWYGEYELQIGNWKLTIRMKEGGTPTSANILVKDWTR